MMGLRRKLDPACAAIREQLESAAEGASGARTEEELFSALAPRDREHALRCEDCRVAAGVYVASRDLLKELRPYGAASRPWFAPRVMALIAARENELGMPAPVSALLPKVASRVAWAAAVALLAAGTWFYSTSTPATREPSMNAPESLFETQPPVPQTHDEVLMSLASVEN